MSLKARSAVLAGIVLALVLWALGLHDGLQEEFRVELAEARLAEAHDASAARVGLAVDRGHDDVERVLAIAPELLEGDSAPGRAVFRSTAVDALCLAAADLTNILCCGRPRTSAARAESPGCEHLLNK